MICRIHHSSKIKIPTVYVLSGYFFSKGTFFILFFSKLLGNWPQCLDRSSNGFFDHIVNYIRYFVEYFFFRFRICIDDLPVGIIYQFFVILSNFGLKSLGFIPKNKCINIIFELKNSK